MFKPYLQLYTPYMSHDDVDINGKCDDEGETSATGDNLIIGYKMNDINSTWV